MNKKMLGICLAAAVSSIGCLAGATAVATNNSQIEARADVLSDNGPFVRLWVASDLLNQISNGNGYPVLWIHKGNETVYTTAVNSESGKAQPNLYQLPTQSHRNFWYFDIPFSNDLIGSTVTAQRYVGAANTTNFADQSFESCANSVLYLWGWQDNSGKQGTWSVGQSGIGTVDSPTTHMAATALSGLYACSSSDYNGFGGIDTFAKTWIISNSEFTTNTSEWTWKLTAYGDMDTDLDKQTIMDYADGADWTNPSTEKERSIDAYSKLMAMVERFSLMA